MRRLILLTIFCLSWLPFWAPGARALSAGGLVAAANSERAAAGLPALNYNGALSVAAANKAADMIRNNYWSHVSPSGVGPWYWISAAGYPYLYAGENLAQGYSDDYSVMSAWMNSPEHRANVLGANYRDMGCGFASGVLLGVQTTVAACDFGSTAAELAPSRPAALPRTAAARPAPAPVQPSMQPAAGSQPAPVQAAAPVAAPQPAAVPDFYKRSVLFRRPVSSDWQDKIKGLMS